MHTISENDLFHRLSFDNPWWRFKVDTKIKFLHPPQRMAYQAFSQRVRATPQNENDTGKIKTGRINVLAGPLRTGKTVMLRQLVAEIIESGVPPRQVMYCSLATPSYAAADLFLLFELFCRQYGHTADTELYVFFDEVQYIDNWQAVLKKLKKMRPNAHLTVAVSSDSPKLVMEDNTEPDGAEPTLDTFILPPLTFAEFLSFRKTDTKLFIGLEDGSDSAKVMLRQNALSALNTEFHRYINFGGFLEGVMPGPGGKSAPAFIRDGASDRVLHKDFASLHGVNNPQDLNKLLGLVAYNTGREVSIDDLAKHTGIAKNTVRKYLDYLEHAFLIRRLPRIDRKAKRFQRAVAFKVYLTTPCLYAALFGPVSADDAVFSRLAETALVAQWLGSKAMGQLAYASWRNGGMDLVIMDLENDVPVRVYDLDWESAYGSESKGPSGLVSFIEGTNREAQAYILTRDTARPASMRGVEITMAPISLYAYMAGRNPDGIH